MPTFAHLFATCELDVVVPNTSLSWPPDAADDWLMRLKTNTTERNQAFFDEQLQSILTVTLPSSEDEPGETVTPPEDLLAFLAHLQVSLEATYISSVPTPEIPQNAASALLSPPRSSGVFSPANNNRLNVHHPSIFPPSTPNPTPSTAGDDRRYIRSQGTLLIASIWGQNGDSPGEAFHFLYSKKEKAWIAVYRLAFTVSFLRLQVSDPLLCITVSATLRDKVTTTSTTGKPHPLASYLGSIAGYKADSEPPTPTSATVPESPVREDSEYDEDLNGLVEVNLLEGLTSGPTFSPRSLSLPSTRLGAHSRQTLFSLPAIVPPTPLAPSPSPMTAVRTAHPTLRKSFRKTLSTVSGFRVRMRTVFVPYVLLNPETEGDDREAGNEERTVVLCVEIENSGESGPGIGFAVESVDIDIGGEGAKANLIGWSDKDFPLLVGSLAQFNLLYAVSFIQRPDDVDGLSLNRDEKPGAGADLQRAVAINIHGRPYSLSGDSISYPTNTFISRWNCVLDLSTQNSRFGEDMVEYDPLDAPSALPEPASPFPLFSPRTLMSPGGNNNITVNVSSSNTTPQASNALALLKKPSRRQTSPLPTPTRLVTPREPPLPPIPSPNGSSKMSFTPPSLSLAVKIPRSPTTYGPPPGMTGELDESQYTSMPTSYFEQITGSKSPMTPAYPSYSAPASMPSFTGAMLPMASGQANGNVGPSVEIRRERGTGMMGLLGLGGSSSAVPQTPMPVVGASNGFAEQQMQMSGGGYMEQQQQRVHGQLQQQQQQQFGNEAIVVSIGLLPVLRNHKSKIKSDGKTSSMDMMIYPLDSFTLDIFVFNQSNWTRRFEVSCPERRRRRGAKDGAGKGILPLDNRVRIGPLRPATCQSVRMDFLAVSPGVHAVETLTLTDVESGFSMNLRSVMDVVVHDPID